MIKRFLSAAAVLALSVSVAQANEFGPALRDFADSQVRGWLSDPTVIQAIKSQNGETAALSEDQIIALDKQWRAETAAGSRPMIDGVLGNALSGYLQQKKEGAEGLVTEIFVMDAKGLNVGQSDVTSDYWQGDEAKWKETFLVGPSSVHVSDVEMDESTQTFQSQVSLPVVDPANGEVIGAVTVGVNVELLAQ